MERRLEIPKNWQDFETLCQMLWREIWSDPNTQKNGRQGQPQCGVDVFGRPNYTGTYAGVQCKDRDVALGSNLKATDLEDECKHATQFQPKISSFTLATTAPRDSSIQEHARKLTQTGKFPFTTQVWFWGDIEEEIRFRPNVRKAYYPDVEVLPGESTSVKMSRFSAKDQFYAFFSRPDVNCLIAPRLREFLIPLAYELADNAYIHGRASQFRIDCDEQSVVFEDDGIDFNPSHHLDSTKTTYKSHVGSFVFASFLNEFSKHVVLDHQYVSSEGKHRNRFTLRFNQPLASFGPVATHHVSVELAWTFSRPAAEQAAALIPIPHGTTHLIISINDAVVNFSGLAAFVQAMLNRLPEGVRLTISLPSHPLTKMVPSWFNDPRLTFQLR